jgi:hypothetical protein
MSNLYNKYENVINPAFRDENVISHMVSNKAFLIAQELNAKYGHKIIGYIPYRMRWGSDNPEPHIDGNHRAIVMEAKNNLPSYYVYYHDENYAICTPKWIKERGNRHVTYSKKLSSLMKSIRDKDALPKDILGDLMGISSRGNGYAGYDIKRKYIHKVADTDHMLSELHNISLHGSVLGQILKKALGYDVDVSGAIQNTIKETLDKITAKEEDIESSVANKLCVFDKPVKVVGHEQHTGLYYQYDIKIDGANNSDDEAINIVSDVKCSYDLEELPCFDEVAGILTMWGIHLGDKQQSIRNKYFLNPSWSSDNLYSEDLGVLAISENGVFNHAHVNILDI